LGALALRQHPHNNPEVDNNSNSTLFTGTAGKMSVLPPEVQTDLAQLLDALQSSDNNVRSQAEEHLTNNWQATRPEMLLMGLVEQLQGASDATVRHPSPNT
jgi:oligoendopeptidase F